MKSCTRIRLLLVDDHFVVRMGLSGSLALESEMEVVATCGDGPEAIDLYRQHHPDVVIMDGRLPGMSGAEATAAIRREFPQARILILSVRDGEEDIFQAVQAGASGYLHKAAQRSDIIAAVRTLSNGQDYFPPAIAAKLSQRRQRPELTDREIEVLRRIVDGQSNKEIASALNLAEVTVKLHVGHLLEKLGVADRTQAATAAILRGYIHLDET
jgi:DNA-binding NarL/FixJ family response regulator